MKRTLSQSFLIVFSCLGILAVAKAANPAASFDTQLKQAQQQIQRDAEVGLLKQQGSFDTQLRQAQHAIDQLAKHGDRR